MIQPYQSARALLGERAGLALSLLRGLPGLQDVLVEQSRDTPLPKNSLPWLGYYAWLEDGDLQNDAGTAPLFLMTAQLHLVARVSATLKEDCQALLDALTDGAKNLVITHPEFLKPPVKALRRVEVKTTIDGTGDSHDGSSAVILHVEMFDEFAPLTGDDLLTLKATIAAFGAAGATQALTVSLPTTPLE